MSEQATLKFVQTENEEEETEEEPTEDQVNTAAAALAAEANGAVKPAAEEVKIPKYVAVMVKPDQYAAIKAFAGDKAISGVCLQIIADVVGFKVETLAKPARQKYDTPEQRKQAAAVRAKTKNAALNEFLAKHAAEFEALMAAKAIELAAASNEAPASS